MSVIGSVRRSSMLLKKIDRLKLAMIIIAQTGLGILDLVGVLLVGFVVSIAYEPSNSSNLPPAISHVLAFFNLESIPRSTLIFIVAGTAAIALLTKSILSVLIAKKTLHFLAVRQAMISSNLATELLKLPLLKLQANPSQKSVYAVTTGVGYAILTTLGQAVSALSEIGLLLVLGVGLLFVDPIVTLFSMIFFLIVAVVLQKLLAGWAGRLGKGASDAEVESYASIQEALKTYREIFVLHRRNNYSRKFRDLRLRAVKLQADLQFITLVPKYVFEVALVLGGFLLVGVIYVSRGAEQGIALIAVFLAAGTRIVPSLLRIQSSAIAIRAAEGSAAVTFELVEELRIHFPSGVDGCDPAIEIIDANISIKEITIPTVQINDLSLKYPASTEYALRGLNLIIPSGTFAAIVGKTGSGKSSLTDLILGVIQPTEGSVTIGGQTPRLAIESRPGSIGYVPQETVLINGTVRDNVCIGMARDEIDDSRVWDALEKAHVAKLVSSRDGLETLVGENGIALSGGQKQRVGVARALYTQPSLLVLDEATSSLDSQSEIAIERTLLSLGSDVTRIVIAHRLTSVKEADLFIVLSNGCVDGFGSFDEVLEQSTEFRTQAKYWGML